jgi:ABC-type transporter Mla maintaining outer membrane lipid asymmetry ATPase subunit MlaF
MKLRRDVSFVFQVAKLYHDASIGNTINIIVTRLVLLTEDQVSTTFVHKLKSETSLARINF